MMGRLILVFAILLSFSAFAHDRKAMSDPDRGAWFNSLKMPSGYSCCNVTDCKQTEAEWRDNQWWAIIKGSYGTAWKAIPPDKVLPKPKSIDGDAYVCYSQSAISAETVSIYCFVPPDMGN